MEDFSLLFLCLTLSLPFFLVFLAIHFDQIDKHKKRNKLYRISSTNESLTTKSTILVFYWSKDYGCFIDERRYDKIELAYRDWEHFQKNKPTEYREGHYFNSTFMILTEGKVDKNSLNLSDLNIHIWKKKTPKSDLEIFKYVWPCILKHTESFCENHKEILEWFED